MKVAYILNTSNAANYKVGTMILPQLEEGRHGAEVLGIFFFDDNAFMLLRTEDQRTAFLHVSCTEWKNTFSFELYGHNGKLQIDGLGGSYGVERLTWYKMLPEMGPPETVSWEYPMHDNSWQVEMNQFRQDIKLGRQPQPGLTDAVAVLQIVESLYEQSGYDHRP